MDIIFGEHDIIETEYGTMCVKCLREWKKQPAGSQCPQLPVFSWSDWSHGYMTKKQLNDAGYNTGAKLPPIVGVIPRSDSPQGYLRLYDPTQATPKNKPTEAQIAALQKAQAALAKKWKCPICGRQKYYINDKLCEYCDYEQDREIDRNAAIEWARDLLKQEFVIMDTETTGLYNAEIVEIAIIDQTGAVLVDQRIKPLSGARMYEETNGVSAVSIHGITIEALQDAPVFPDVYPAIRDAIQDKYLIVYNLDFDLPLLRDVCHLHELPKIKLRDRDCAMKMYAQFYGDWHNYFGSYTWQPLSGGDHSALGDAKATLAVIQNMAKARKTHKYELKKVRA